MEKSVSTALSEQEKEHEDDQGKAVPMTLVSNKEDLIALEYPQGEARIPAFFKDAKTSLENTALLRASKERGIDLKEAVPNSSEKLETMNREGKVTEMYSHKEGINLLSLFICQDSDAALKDCEVTGKSSAT